MYMRRNEEKKSVIYISYVLAKLSLSYPAYEKRRNENMRKKSCFFKRKLTFAVCRANSNVEAYSSANMTSEEMKRKSHICICPTENGNKVFSELQSQDK